MQQFTRVEVVASGEKPDYMPLARYLLGRICDAYQSAEFEKAFRQWMREQGKELNMDCPLSRIPDEVLEDPEEYGRVYREIWAEQ